MKKIILYFSISLFLSSCVSRKMDGMIEFRITNKSIRDSSFINLNIQNKTRSNYYLPTINSYLDPKWLFIMPYKDYVYYSMPLAISDEKKDLGWKTSNCFDEHIIDEEMEKLCELWKQKKKSIEVKDLILLKSGESIKIKVPINLNLKITKECSWELENYRNEKELNIAINYPKKEKELASKFLSPKTLDSLKQMGYELYDKEINSNKVPLILE